MLFRSSACGEVVGTSFDQSGNTWHAFLWAPKKPNGDKGTITLLEQGCCYNEANTINDSGQIAGSTNVYNLPNALLWYVNLHSSGPR